MPKVLLNASTLSNIANAIRTKLGVATLYKPGQMADAITSISSGGVAPTGTKNITANGTNIDVTSYAYVDVAVPNSYNAGDEGKVVSNGTLVNQSSDSVATNGIVDTTLINSLTVNVPASGITPTGTKQITINSNGTTTEDVTNYANAEITVAVPTSQAVGPQFTLIGQSTHTLQAYTDTSTAETIDTQISTNVDYVFLLVVITCDGTPVSDNTWAGTAIGLLTLKPNHTITTDKTLYANKGTVNSLVLSETSKQSTYCTYNGITLVDGKTTIQFQRKASSVIPELPAGTYTVKVYGLTSL